MLRLACAYTWIRHGRAVKAAGTTRGEILPGWRTSWKGRERGASPRAAGFEGSWTRNNSASVCCGWPPIGYGKARSYRPEPSRSSRSKATYMAIANKAQHKTNVLPRDRRRALLCLTTPSVATNGIRRGILPHTPWCCQRPVLGRPIVRNSPWSDVLHGMLGVRIGRGAEEWGEGEKTTEGPPRCGSPSVFCGVRISAHMS